MAPAEVAEVVTRRRSALAERDDVVLVAGLGGAGAPGEHACLVAVLGLGGEPVGDLVLADVDVLGQVDDRLHGDACAGGTAPGADLVGVDEGAGVGPPGQVELLVAGPG